MSRIYFHTPERTVELYGSERAYMGSLASDIALAVLRVRADVGGVEWLRSVTDGEPDYIWESPDPARAWRTWFRVSYGERGRLKLPNGNTIDPFDLALNTLIATHSPSLTLCAKMHGTCEDYAWIDPSNARWFAETIEAGRNENVLRPDVGWEGVAELAREVESGLRGPIVTSYSVCERFPNSGVADWPPPTCEACEGTGKPNPDMKYTDVDYDYCTSCGGEGVLSDLWYDLSDAEQWDLAERGIRARAYNREISPQTMNVGFMSGASAFDLLAVPEAMTA